MKNLINKESYLLRRAEQLHQWERVIYRLISRADRAKDRSKTELHHHIVKIWVKKARTEVKLRHLKKAEKGKWNDLKADLEESLGELREAFLKSSANPKSKVWNISKN